MNPPAKRLRHLLPVFCAAVLLGGGPAVRATPVWTPGLAAPAPMTVLHHSHVKAWFDGIDDHLKYPEVDVIVQDLDITAESELPPWQALVRQWHTQGKLFFAELRPATPLGHTFETLMDDPGLRAAACVDIGGAIIGPRWQEGRTYKGHPVQFFCSNNPRYRSFLRYLIYLYHEAGADGIHVDDAGGTPGSLNQAGCFCEHCMAGFRDYLRAKYPPARWQELNFGAIDAFDYRALVRKHATDRASFQAAHQRGEIPLYQDFADFLRQSDAELFISLHAQLDKLSGRHVPLAWDNFNFGPSRTPYYPTIDVFAPEINFGALAPGNGDNTRFAPSTLLLNRLSDALGRWYSPIPAPSTWAAAKAKNLTGMLRLWVAATYANGGLPRFPRKGWCTVVNGEIDWYYPPKEEFAPLYDFVRANRALFDGYENVAQVGLVFAERPGEVIGNSPFKPVVESLVNLNVPFGIAFAGGPITPQRLSPDDAQRFELLLVPASTKLDAAQQQVVDDWKRRNLVLDLDPKADLAALLAGRVDPLVALESPADVRLFPRAKSGDRHAPVVCHVVNWNYDPATNTTAPQKNVPVRLRTALTGGAKVTKIVYHAPGQSARPLDFTDRGHALHVTIPEVALWGILELRVE